MVAGVRVERSTEIVMGELLPKRAVVLDHTSLASYPHTGLVQRSLSERAMAMSHTIKGDERDEGRSLWRSIVGRQEMRLGWEVDAVTRARRCSSSTPVLVRLAVRGCQGQVKKLQVQGYVCPLVPANIVRGF